MNKIAGIKLVKKIRCASEKHLPLNNSLIPLDLLIQIALSDIVDEELSIKSLFSSIPHSEMGIRYHLRRLLEDGWVEIHTKRHDRRTKFVTSKPILLHNLELLEKEIHAAIYEKLD